LRFPFDSLEESPAPRSEDDGVYGRIDPVPPTKKGPGPDEDNNQGNNGMH